MYSARVKVRKGPVAASSARLLPCQPFPSPPATLTCCYSNTDDLFLILVLEEASCAAVSGDLGYRPKSKRGVAFSDDLGLEIPAYIRKPPVSDGVQPLQPQQHRAG